MFLKTSEIASRNGLMNRYEVRITKQAEGQIHDIAYYLTVVLHNPDAAGTLVNDLYATFDEISNNPERQFLVDEEPWHSEGIRKIQVKNYMVYFWIDIEKAAVQVTGVCFAERQQDKFLARMTIEK